MKVSHTNSNPASPTDVSSARQAQRAAQTSEARKNENAAGSSSAGAESANATISPKAREFATASAVASAAPDVREEKIAELKKRIAEGKYHVDANAVADKMVDEHLRMHGMS